MKQHLLRRGALGVASVLAAVAAGPVQTATAATHAAQCPEPFLSHPFAGDSRWYTLAPGETAGDFYGAGWVLTGGARIVTATVAGNTASVLDLPAGSTATSPAMCVDQTYPLARMNTRTLGKAPDNSTKFYTVPAGGSAVSGGMPVLGTTSWATSPPDNVGSSAGGAEQVQFKFVAGKNAADLQVSNLYIDPMMRR